MFREGGMLDNYLPSLAYPTPLALLRAFFWDDHRGGANGCVIFLLPAAQGLELALAGYKACGDTKKMTR